MAPGKDDFNGQITEHLKTKITASYCQGGYLYETTLEKTEQATDLKGVQIQAIKGTANVNRKTTLPGLQTSTASSDCVTKTGAPTTQRVSPQVVLRGNWSRSAAAVTYTGTDCGGTGHCTYFDANARGAVSYTGQNLDMAAASKAWLWSGTWDLGA